MTSLIGQHAIVTGGGSGIGRAIAAALVRAGARVTIAGRRAEALAETAALHGGIEAVPADVTDERAVARLFDAAIAARGPVDVVVANAGRAASAPFARTSLAEWSDAIAVNLTGVFLTARAALRAMDGRTGGRIIFIASTAALKGYPYVAPYCAAKHGVVGLARALALETAKSGVTVNAVCPGYTETPLLDTAVAMIAAKTGRSQDEARASLARSNPQGRLVTPEEVAATVLWLAGPEARSITGQAIAVAGGEL